MDAIHVVTAIPGSGIPDPTYFHQSQITGLMASQSRVFQVQQRHRSQK